MRRPDRGVAVESNIAEPDVVDPEQHDVRARSSLGQAEREQHRETASECADGHPINQARSSMVILVPELNKKISGYQAVSL